MRLTAFAAGLGLGLVVALPSGVTAMIETGWVSKEDALTSEIKKINAEMMATVARGNTASTLR